MQKGFTLLELLAVIAIIGILAAIAYPNYQNYVVRTKRADMMSEMQNMGKQLEAKKLAAGRGGYKNSFATGMAGSYPKSGAALYDVVINDLETNNGNWQIVATPIATGSQAQDGTLTLRKNGEKCRGDKCGMGEEWKN